MDSESSVSPILAIASIAVVFAVLLLMLAAEAPAAARVQGLIYAHAQKGMLLVAGTATSASLYYSEVAGFTPCDFCWYQRIMMYPLAVLLLAAVVTRDRIPSRYIVTLATIGLGLSVYHYQLQLYPEQGGTCSAFVSCTAKYVNEFGFVTIPFMAGAGFLAVLLLQVAEWRIEHVYRQWERATQPATGAPEE